MQDDLGSSLYFLGGEGRSKASYGYREFGETKIVIRRFSRMHLNDVARGIGIIQVSDYERI